MTYSLNGSRQPGRSDLSAKAGEGFGAWVERVRRAARSGRSLSPSTRADRSRLIWPRTSIASTRFVPHSTQLLAPDHPGGPRGGRTDQILPGNVDIAGRTRLPSNGTREPGCLLPGRGRACPMRTVTPLSVRIIKILPNEQGG